MKPSKSNVIAMVTTMLAVASIWAAADLQFQHVREVYALKKDLAAFQASMDADEAKRKADLVERGFAEYDRKTGEWYLLTKAQFAANDKVEQEQASAFLLPEVNLGATETTKASTNKSK